MIARYTDAGGTVTYSYDAANEVKNLYEPGGSCTAGSMSKCTQFGYTTNGQRNLTTYPSGETVAVGYDLAGRETSVTAKRPSGTVFFSRTIGYQTSGATPADTELVQSTIDSPGSTTTNGYDAYSRLTSAVVGSTTYGYSYDANGNRTSATKTATSAVNYGYNTADQLCESGTSAITASYTTLACTGTAGAGNTKYSWDADGSQLTGGTSFAYNTQDQTTTAGSLIATYPDAGQSERSSTTTSSVTTSLLNGVEGLSGQTVGTGTPVFFTRDSSGNLIGMRVGAGSSFTGSYYTLDQQASVLRLTDSTGNTDTATYAYDPYGQALSATGTQATVNPYRYATGYYDTTTGLLKLGSRYDNPALGRWTQHDRAGFAITDPTELDPYTYAGDNPASNIDPTGASVAGDCASGALDGAEGGAEAGAITGDGVLAGAAAGAATGCGQALAVDATDALFGSEAASDLAGAFEIKGAIDNVKTLTKGAGRLVDDISSLI